MQHFVQWYQTKWGRLSVALAGLGTAFLLLNLAINSGSLWQYTLLIILTIAGGQHIVQFIAAIIHDHKTAKA